MVEFDAFLSEKLRCDFNDDGTHSAAAGVFPMRALNLIQLENGFNRYGDLTLPEPFEKLFEGGCEVLRSASHAEESGSPA